MEKIIEIIKENKKKFYIILVFIILIIILVILNFVNKANNKNKDFASQNYVFTQIEDGKNVLPYININNAKVEIINEKLQNVYYNVTQNNKNNFMYEYYIENDILYLYVFIDEYNDDDINNPRYIFYYINIKNNKVYSLEEILEIHDLDIDTIEMKVKNQLNNSYIEETNLGYVEEGFCDFECYLDSHEVNPLNKNMLLYYNGDEFKMYLNHTIDTVYYVKTNPIEFPHEFDI